MTKKILIATDGSEHATKAIEFTGDMASKYDASVCIIHVVQKTKIPKEILEYLRIEGVKEQPDMFYMQKISEKILAEAKNVAVKHGIKNIESVVLQGDPAEEIIKFAIKNDIDMIVMGHRGLGMVKELLLGSVASKVSRIAKCTCIMVK